MSEEEEPKERRYHSLSQKLWGGKALGFFLPPNKNISCDVYPFFMQQSKHMKPSADLVLLSCSGPQADSKCWWTSEAPYKNTLLEAKVPATNVSFRFGK